MTEKDCDFTAPMSTDIGDIGNWILKNNINISNLNLIGYNHIMTMYLLFIDMSRDAPKSEFETLNGNLVLKSLSRLSWLVSSKLRENCVQSYTNIMKIPLEIHGYTGMINVLVANGVLERLPSLELHGSILYKTFDRWYWLLNKTDEILEFKEIDAKNRLIICTTCYETIDIDDYFQPTQECQSCAFGDVKII